MQLANTKCCDTYSNWIKRSKWKGLLIWGRRKDLYEKQANINPISIPNDIHWPPVLPVFLPGKGGIISSSPSIHPAWRGTICSVIIGCKLLTKSTQRKPERKPYYRSAVRFALSSTGKEGNPEGAVFHTEALAHSVQLWLIQQGQVQLTQQLLASLSRHGDNT